MVTQLLHSYYMQEYGFEVKYNSMLLPLATHCLNFHT